MKIYADQAIEAAVRNLFQSFNSGTRWDTLAEGGPIKSKWRMAYRISLSVLEKENENLQRD